MAMVFIGPLIFHRECVQVTGQADWGKPGVEYSSDRRKGWSRILMGDHIEVAISQQYICNSCELATLR
jgi:hypothetical protein